MRASVSSVHRRTLQGQRELAHHVLRKDPDHSVSPGRWLGLRCQDLGALVPILPRSLHMKLLTAVLCPIAFLAALAEADTNATAPTLAADPSYPDCNEQQIDFVTESVASEALACGKKTGYDFLYYPTPTDDQKTAFCSDCPDLVAKVKSLKPPRCAVYVFGTRETPYPVKTAFVALFGQCGVTNIQEADGVGAISPGEPAGATDAKNSTGGSSEASVATKTPTTVPAPTQSSGSVVGLASTIAATAAAAAVVMAV